MAGTYYVTVLPETSKFEAGIRQAGQRAERGMRLRPEFDTSGAQQAGQRAGRDVQSGMDTAARSGGGIRGFFRADGARAAGEQAGREVNSGLQSANVGSGLGSQVRANLGDGETVGRSFGARLAGGLKAAAAIGGATAVAGIGYAMTKGFSRLVEIDTAKFKLQALGNSAQDVQNIMDNATAAVKGTAFSLNEAATTSASAVAAGIKPGKELTQYLGTTADAAAVAGTSLAEMGSIFNKVSTANKAYTGDLQMLSDRGIPIFQWIAKEAGVTADEVGEMAKKGQIDSALFRTAIEKNIGGAAKGMGGSFMGALANLKASIARFGAGLAGPVVEGLRPMLNAGMTVFDGITKAMGPSMKSLTAMTGAWSADMAAKVTAWAENGGVERAAARISSAVNSALGWLRQAGAWISDVWKQIQNPDAGGADAGATLKSVGDAAKGIGDAAQSAGPALRTIGESLVAIGPETLRGVLVPGLQLLGGALKFAADNASWLLPVAGGFLAIRAATSAAVPFVQAYAATMNVIRTPVIMAQALAQRTLAAAMREHTAALAANTGAQIGNDTATNAGVLAKTRAAAAAIASTVAEKARAAATKIGTAIQLAFNAVMAMNPLVLIIAAVVAAGVAIWAFFTKTETGRKLWDKIWNGIKAVTNAVVGWIMNTAVPWLKQAWDRVSQDALWLWHNVIEPVFNGVKGVIEAVVGWIMNTAVPWAQQAWQNFTTGLRVIIDTATSVLNGVREKFTAVVDFVRGLPDKIKSAASGMWDGIGNAFKSVVNGMIRVWNGFASKLSFTTPDWVPGLGGKSFSIPTIAEFAEGGWTGPGSKYQAAGIVHADEFVLSKAARAAIEGRHPGLLDFMNRTGELPALRGYAEGGQVSASSLVNFAKGVEGQPYKWGGVNWGDCSGAVSAIANYATGRDPFGSRFATGSEKSELAARGFKPGLGPSGSLNIGWFNGGPYGGHTAATLPDGTNFEMGGGRGNGQFGGKAAGANDSQFTDHAHLPPEFFTGLDAGSPTTGGAGVGAAAGSGGSGGSGSSSVGSSTSGGGGTSYRAATSAELSSASEKTSNAATAKKNADQSVSDREYALEKAKRQRDELAAKKHTDAQMQDANRRVEVAERELADAKERQTKAADKLTQAQQDESDLKTKGKEVKAKGGKDSDGKSNGLNGSDFGKTFVSGVLESIGLDGSVFSNPLEWPTVKSAMAGVNWLGGLLKGGDSESGSAAGAATSAGAGGFVNGAADAVGLGGFLKNLPGNPVGEATSQSGADWTPQSGSPKLAQGQWNPAQPGGNTVAGTAANTLSAFVPNVAPQPSTTGGPVDNSININGPVGMNPTDVQNKVHSEQNARTRTTVVR